MNKRMNRSGSPSLRSALAVGGVVLMALGLGQVVDTQAAFTDSATANVSTLATGNFFPTPLPATLTCTTSGSPIGSRRANLSWPAVPGATGYLVRLVNSNGSTYRDYPVDAPTTSVNGISTTDPRASVSARVYTKNGPAISSGWTGANTGMSFKDYVTGRTECEGSSSSQANQPWENESTWTPVTGAAGQASFKQSFGRDAAGPGPLLDETTSPTPSPTTTNPPTSTSVPTSSPTTSQPAPTTTDATTTPPLTTTPSTMPSVATPSETSQATSTTASATSRPAVSLVDLDDGLTAKLVDRGGVPAVLLKAGGTEQCSAEIPHAEALENGGNGRLAVTDSDGKVHYVDTSNCTVS